MSCLHPCLLRAPQRGGWRCANERLEYSPRHALHDSIFHNAANRDDSLHLNTERKQLVPRRRLHDQKRQRIDLSRDDGLLCGDTIERGEITQETKGKIDLRSCHVCWRKPTEKAHLDAYADCEGCGERTCFVCMRVCEGLGVVRDERIGDGRFSFGFDGEGHGWQAFGGDGGTDGESTEEERRVWDRDRIEGHRGRVCSRCCVERGSEGDVWCLGCLRAEERMS